MSIQLDKVQPKNKAQLKSLIEYAFNHNIYDLNFIDTSEITNMSWLFENVKYNFDVSSWNVSNVKDMTGMFYCCTNFNCDLSNWNVSHVVDMSQMFYNCKNFNVDLSQWNVSNVTDMHSMFTLCENFKGKGLENWDVSNVTTMSGMFNKCYNFNCDLSKWNVSNVENMSYMFVWCDKITIPNWYKLYRRK